MPHAFRAVALSSTAALLVLTGAPGQAQPSSEQTRTYDPSRADQFQTARLEDTVPGDPEARRVWARHLAYDATVYGNAPVLIYRQLYDQAIDRTNPDYVGFNTFAHGRHLAGPGYQPFKSPNADTLYSNAYLDLRHGPVLLEVPDTGGRYYTVNFLDMFGNATNIGARTFGTGAGRFLIATTEWEGEVPEGATLFRVTNPLMWILMRVLVNDENDFAEAHRLQNQFSIRPINPPPAADPANWPDGNDESAVGFMRILDTVLRNTGWPEGEDALVGRFRGLGITGPRSVGEMIEDSQIRAGIEKGFAEAQAVIRGAMAQNGQPVGAWSEPLDIGRYGYNYLYRSSVNTLGTGANVTDENYPFTSFVDGDGEPLDGSKGVYELRLDPPPPARFFWSVTMYDQRTRELVPNSAGKYLVSDRTPGLVRGPDGSVTIRMQKEPVTGEGAANWLPAPDGPFYLAIRAQGPEAPMLERTWRPPDVRRVGPAGE